MIDLSVLLHINCFFYFRMLHRIFSSLKTKPSVSEHSNNSTLVFASTELDLSLHVSYCYLFYFSTNHNLFDLTCDRRIMSPTSSVTKSPGVFEKLFPQILAPRSNVCNSKKSWNFDVDISANSTWC